MRAVLCGDRTSIADAGKLFSAAADWLLRGHRFGRRHCLGGRWLVGVGLDEETPDHSTISRTRRLIDVETHRKVFLWVLGLLADRGLLKGKTVGVDATTLEANAAMRSIVRRDNGASYEEFLTELAKQ